MTDFRHKDNPEPFSKMRGISPGHTLGESSPSADPRRPVAEKETTGNSSPAPARTSYAAVCERMATKCQNTRTLDRKHLAQLETDAKALRKLAGLIEEAEKWQQSPDDGDTYEVEAFLIVGRMADGFVPSASTPVSPAPTDPPGGETR